EEVAADDVAALAEAHDAFVAEAVDDQALDGAAAGRNGQAGLQPGVEAVQLDGQEGVVAVGQRVGAGAELRVAVDEDRVGDKRQGAHQLDGVDRPGGAGDGELDGVEAGIAGGGVADRCVDVGRGERLAQRDEAVQGDGIVGAGDSNDGGHGSIFQPVEARVEVVGGATDGRSTHETPVR